jgi:hypothetical protein
MVNSSITRRRLMLKTNLTSQNIDSTRLTLRCFLNKSNSAASLGGVSSAASHRWATSTDDATSARINSGGPRVWDGDHRATATSRPRLRVPSSPLQTSTSSSSSSSSNICTKLHKHRISTSTPNHHHHHHHHHRPRTLRCVLCCSIARRTAIAAERHRAARRTQRISSTLLTPCNIKGRCGRPDAD